MVNAYRSEADAVRNGEYIEYDMSNVDQLDHDITMQDQHLLLLLRLFAVPNDSTTFSSFANTRTPR